MCAARYDRAVTVFSPDGHLLQVEYAQEAVNKGSTVVGVRGNDAVILGVEKKALAELQVERTVRKIFSLDKHVFLAFAGLTADARVLVHRAQVECQSHRLTVEDAVTVEHISGFIAALKQKYTQSNGVRPFGVSCLIGGFDYDGKSHLFQTAPSGIFYECKASVTGRSSKIIRDFFEKYYASTELESEDKTIKLAIRALLEVVQADSKNLEIALMRRGNPFFILEETTVANYIKLIEKEKEDQAEKKKKL